MSSSDSELRRGLVLLRPRVAAPLLLFVLLASSSLTAGVLMDREQALAAAFPAAELERVSVYLTKEQAALIEKAAGTTPSSRASFHYRARREGKLVGTAYFDRHIVRTKAETVMIVVTPAGVVDKVEILAFDEPMDYLPPERWLEQFDGKVLGEQLALKRQLRGITGATLSSRSVTQAVRRALALHALLRQAAAEVEAESAGPASE